MPQSAVSVRNVDIKNAVKLPYQKNFAVPSIFMLTVRAYFMLLYLTNALVANV